MINRKVKNATEITYDGIKFRSLLELKVYKALEDAGYKPQYEVEKISLLESFRPKRVWYLDGEPQTMKSGSKKSRIVKGKTYTPDFKMIVNGITVYIEAKGHPNDEYPTTRKMFLKWIEEQEGEIIFSEVHSLRGLNKFIDKLKLL